MSTVNVTVAVAGATLDVMNQIADVIGVVKKAMADGWTPGTDIPQIILTGIHDLGKVVSELGEVQKEYAGDKQQLTNAVVLGGSAVVAAVLG